MTIFNILDTPLAITEHHYAIVDRAIYNKIDKDFLALEVVTPLIQSQAHLYPYLIPLKSMSLNVWEKFYKTISHQISRLETPISSMLLKTELPPSELCSRLANYLIHSINNRNYILRYYDPKVFIQLSWMYSKNELDMFYSLTGVKDWTLYFNKQWHTFSFKKENIDINNLSQMNYQQFKRISLINQLVFQFKPTQSLSEYLVSSEFINNILIKAESFHLDSIEDKKLFVKHSIDYGVDFCLTPTFHKILKKISNPKNTYSYIFEALDDISWKRIKIELDQLEQQKGYIHGHNL